MIFVDKIKKEDKINNAFVRLFCTTDIVLWAWGSHFAAVFFFTYLGSVNRIDTEWVQESLSPLRDLIRRIIFPYFTFWSRIFSASIRWRGRLMNQLKQLHKIWNPRSYYDRITAVTKSSNTPKLKCSKTV